MSNELVLTYTPTTEGQFSVTLTFSPDDGLSQEDQLFYCSLGHGLLDLSLSQTSDVVQHGIKVIKRMEAEQNMRNVMNVIDVEEEVVPEELENVHPNIAENKEPELPLEV